MSVFSLVPPSVGQRCSETPALPMPPQINRPDDLQLIAKVEKQRIKMGQERERAPAPLPGRHLVPQETMRKKRKRNEDAHHLFEVQRHGPSPDAHKRVRAYAHSSGGDRYHQLFHRGSQSGDSQPFHPRGDMQHLERPTHVFTVQNRKEAPYLDFIREGRKKAECRVNTPAFRKVKVGDTIQFHNRFQGILCKVTYLHVYNTFREMVIGEGVQNILPHIYDQKVDGEKLIQRAVQVYENFPLSHRVRQYGAVAIGVIYLREYFKV